MVVLLSRDELLAQLRGKEFGDEKILEGVAIPTFVPKHWNAYVEYAGAERVYLNVRSDWFDAVVPWASNRKVKCQVRWIVDYFTHDGLSKRVEVDTVGGMCPDTCLKLAESVVLRSSIFPNYRSGVDFHEYYHLLGGIPFHHVVSWKPSGFAETFEEEVSLSPAVKIFPSLEEASLHPFVRGWNQWDGMDSADYNHSFSEYSSLEFKLREKMGLFRYKRRCAFCSESPCRWDQNAEALMRDNELVVAHKTVNERVEFLHMQVRIALREEYDSDVKRSDDIPHCCHQGIERFKEDKTDSYNQEIENKILTSQRCVDNSSILAPPQNRK